MTSESINKAQVGDCILFGKYEQDNNFHNGSEDIEWLVLAKEDNKILVISKYGLEYEPFNYTTTLRLSRKSSKTGTTWEECSLRKWLNGGFINEAFSTAEQNQILSTTVTADMNDGGIFPGNVTVDKIFLLSVNEANEYFGDDIARRCRCTPYCCSQGVYIDAYDEWDECDDCPDCSRCNDCDCDRADKAGSWRWWLRARGNFSELTAAVASNGIVGSFGLYAGDYGVVRPAMWISLDL